MNPPPQARPPSRPSSQRRQRTPSLGDASPLGSSTSLPVAMASGSGSGTAPLSVSPRKRLDSMLVNGVQVASRYAQHGPPPKTAQAPQLVHQAKHTTLLQAPRPATTTGPKRTSPSLADLLASTSRTRPSATSHSGKQQPVRAMHPIGVATPTPTIDAAGTGVGSALPESRRTRPAASGLHTSSSSGVFNIWSDRAGNTRTHSHQRPVTARANLHSAREDDDSPDDSFGSLIIRPQSRGSTRPDARIQTAAAGSTGAHFRAQSAHVLYHRPPSRQRPPNQALHLGDALTSPTSNQTRPTRHGWDATNEPSNSAEEPFPAAPSPPLVHSSSRSSQIHRAGDAASHGRGPSLAFTAYRRSPTDHDSFSASSDTDTLSSSTDTSYIDESTEADPPIPSARADESVDETPHSGARTNLRSMDRELGFEPPVSLADAPDIVSRSFVSLHNILQLQSEKATRSKSRSGSASKRRSSGQAAFS